MANPNKKFRENQTKKKIIILNNSGKSKKKIRENQTKNRRNPNKKKTALLIKFSLIIFWISLLLSLDFPDSFENPGNSNKKLCFFAVLQILYLDIAVFGWI
jgi:hypothetical protein